MSEQTNQRIERRTFLKTVGLAGAGAVVGAGTTRAAIQATDGVDPTTGGAGAQTMPPVHDKVPHRVLGRTGIRVPMLAFGTAQTGYGLETEAAAPLIEEAIDMGVTWIDTAPTYHRALDQLAPIMARRRGEVFLMTKTDTEDRQEALDILRRSMERMGVDHVDAVLVHSLGGKDIGRVLGPNGSLAGLYEAREQGLTRLVGFSAHNAPWKSAQLLREADVDMCMLALNYADRHTYNFDEDVVPLAAERGVGVLAMKSMGGPGKMRYTSTSPSQMEASGETDFVTPVHYALNLPGVASVSIGMRSVEQVRHNIETIKAFESPTREKLEMLDRRGAELSREWGEHFGPAERERMQR